MSMWILYRIFEWFRCLAVYLLFNFCHNFKQILYYPKILDICRKKEKLYNIVGMSSNVYILFVKFKDIVSITNSDVNKNYDNLSSV